jgi:hypothetical protein
MAKIATVYDLRGSTTEPRIYLGANIVKHQLPTGTTCWGMSSTIYIKNAITNIQELLKEEGKQLRTSKRRGRIILRTTFFNTSGCF